MKTIKTSALVGLGALGILFGRKMPGVQVIADEDRIARYAAQPVVCNGQECQFHYVTPAQGQPVDLVLVAVKATGLEQALADIRNFVGPDTILLSVLNGITSEERMEQVYPGHALWSVAIGMDATRKGRELVFTQEGKIQFGERDGSLTPRVQAVAEYLSACGIAHEVCTDILYKQWNKLMVNDGLNQAAAAFDLPYGGLGQPGPAQDKMRQAMQEVIRLANLEGIPLPEDNDQQFLQAALPTFNPEGMPSMRQDVLAHRPTEMEEFAGVVRARAKKYGMATPANDFFYDRIRAIEAGYLPPRAQGHKLYFTRHGETVWNVENKICGMTDSPLTPRGLAQAQALGQAVKAQGADIDMVLYSPLSRAADTARAIAQATGLPTRCEPRLREQCFGRYEGTPRDGAEFREAKTHFADHYDGGESMLQLAQRIYNLLDELKAQPDKTYLLVAHNGIARVVQSYFEDMTNEEYAQAGIRNCQLMEYHFE